MDTHNLAPLAAIPLVALVPCRAPAAVALDHRIRFDIHANSRVEEALIEWGLKAGVTVMINTYTVEPQATPRILGTFRARAALNLLLQNTGLSYAEDGKGIGIVATSVDRIHGPPHQRPDRPVLLDATQRFSRDNPGTPFETSHPVVPRITTL